MDVEERSGQQQPHPKRSRAPTVEEILGNVRNMVHFFEKEGVPLDSILKRNNVSEHLYQKPLIGRKSHRLNKREDLLKSASLIKKTFHKHDVAVGTKDIEEAFQQSDFDQPLYANLGEPETFPPPPEYRGDGDGRNENDEPLYMNLTEASKYPFVEAVNEQVYDVPRALNIYDCPKDVVVIDLNESTQKLSLNGGGVVPAPNIPPPDYECDAEDDCGDVKRAVLAPVVDEDLGLEVIPEEPEPPEEERAPSTVSSLDEGGSGASSSSTSGVHSQTSPSPSSRKVSQKEKDRLIEIYHETIRQRTAKTERKQLDLITVATDIQSSSEHADDQVSLKPAFPLAAWDPTPLLFHLYRVPEPKKRTKDSESGSSSGRREKRESSSGTSDRKSSRGSSSSSSTASKSEDGHSYIQPVPLPRDPALFKDILIVDLGGCSSRAGILSGSPTLPQLFFPTAIAPGGFVGHQALLPANRKDLFFPFKHRPAQRDKLDILSIKAIFQHICACLRVQPQKYRLMLSLPSSLSSNSQKELLELLFDSFKFRSVNMAHQTILSLCSYSTTTGIVVDVGERVDVVPITDGYIVDAGVSRFNYGGPSIQNHLQKGMTQKHSSFSTQIEQLILRYIQEEACYCSLEYKHDLKRFRDSPIEFEKVVDMTKYFKDRSFEPWRSVCISLQRFQATEGLFSPQIWGLDNPGVVKLVHKALQESSVDVRRELARNIYLAGGVSLLPGFARRLASELDRMTPPGLKIKVHGSPYRYHAAFLGACVLANSSAYTYSKMDREDWINGRSTVKWRV